MPTDTVHISELAVQCIIGVNPEEREQEQPLLLDLEVGLDLSLAGRSGRISDTCNYDQVSQEISALLKFRRYHLLEMAAEELAAMLFGVHKNLQEITLTLEKPQALASRARSAGVTIQRTANHYPRREELTRFGQVEILLETKEAGLYLLHIAPGKTIPPHYHRVMDELEWRVQGQLSRNEIPLLGLNPQVWNLLEVHSYRNEGSSPATLFCCDRPCFIPDDEIVLSEASL